MKNNIPGSVRSNFYLNLVVPLVGILSMTLVSGLAIKIVAGLTIVLTLVAAVFLELKSKGNFTDVQTELVVYKQIFDKIPVNVIVANNDSTITMVNTASVKTLKEIEKLLPIPVERIKGSSYDVFHKNPAKQRQLLADPRNLPYQTNIKLGDETLDLLVTALYDEHNNYIGPLVTWSVITDKINLVKKTEDSKENLRSTVLSLVSESGEASDGLSRSISGVVAAIEEMNASIQEIASNTTTAADMTKRTVEEAQIVERLIAELETYSKEIGDIAQVVSSISNQTNLLALNATIEAARAGDAGKGFAVVASEVKALASQTGEATKDIQEKISSIQLQTKEAFSSVQATANSVKSINDVVVSIASAIEEQTAVSNEISSNMNTAGSRVGTVTKSIENISKSVEHNISMMG